MPAKPYLDDILKKAKETASVNPYSGLFDYDEMAKEEEARKIKLQEGQKKIQRTNAIGDALRLISEGVTGSMGASIAPRAVNPGIMQASQRINALEDQSQSNMDRLKLQDLAMKEKGLTYDLGQQATRDARTWEGQKIAEDRTFRKEISDAELASRERMTNAELGSREKIAGINANAGIQEAIIRQKQQQQGEGLDAQNPYNQRWTQLYGKKAPYMTLSDVESGANIPLTDGQAMQIAKWMRSDPAIDQRTKMQIDAGDLTNNLVFKQMIADNWDRYGDMVRKMALGEKISPADQQKIVAEGNLIKRAGEYDKRLSAIKQGTRRGDKELAALNKEYADVVAMDKEELVNTPIAPADSQQQVVSPEPTQVNPIGKPADLAKVIAPVAKSIYNRAETKEGVERDLKALVNSKYKTATPAEKAAIYNDLIKQF